MITKGTGDRDLAVITVTVRKRWRLGTVARHCAGRGPDRRDGEILTRGPHVMKGYFNKPEATAEAIDSDGWFHTGDIGHLDKESFLAITDRKKDLIVLAGGKKAAPQPIEGELKKSAFIGVPIVIGDRQKFLAVLIVPNFDKLREWAAAGNHDVRWEAIDAHPEIRRLYQREIDAYNAGKPHHEQIRAFAILPSDLTIEDGSITPTLKVKRRLLENRYHSLIEGMYEAAEIACLGGVVVDGLRPRTAGRYELRTSARELDASHSWICWPHRSTGDLDQVIYGTLAAARRGELARVRRRAAFPTACRPPGQRSAGRARDRRRWYRIAPPTPTRSSPAGSSPCPTSRSSLQREPGDLHVVFTARRSGAAAGRAKFRPRTQAAGRLRWADGRVCGLNIGERPKFRHVHGSSREERTLRASLTMRVALARRKLAEESCRPHSAALRGMPADNGSVKIRPWKRWRS